MYIKASANTCFEATGIGYPIKVALAWKCLSAS